MSKLELISKIIKPRLNIKLSIDLSFLWLLLDNNKNVSSGTSSESLDRWFTKKNSFILFMLCPKLD